MGHEERERKLEQALERHLRSDTAGARNEAAAHADVRGKAVAGDTCPDAGTLAAFHEGMLSGAEMNIATEHIGGCSRCQQILLLLEATDEIPLQVELENDLKMREPAVSTGGLHADDAGIQTPNLTIAGQAKPASKAPMNISHGRGFKALRWAAPAGAIAAALLIWIVVREGKIRTQSHSENVQVAQEQPSNERPAPPALPPASASPASSSPSAGAESKALSASRKDNAITRQRDVESGAIRAQEPFTPKLKAKSAGRGVAASDSSTTAPTPNSTANAPKGARDFSYLIALAPPPKTEPQPPKQSTETVSASAAPIDTSSADLSKQSAVPAPPASSGASANAADKKAGATPTQTVVLDFPVVPLVPTEQMATPDNLHGPSFETSGKTAQGKNITSAPGYFRRLLAPGGTVLWRLGARGQIERSVDGGVSWVQQRSGVKSELLAGSAPSESVCWIIGRGGTILKTTDGGVHWSKVAWPNTGEITGIQAFDAMHAIVYGGTADIPGRFATNDGGATWFRPNK